MGFCISVTIGRPGIPYNVHVYNNFKLRVTIMMMMMTDMLMMMMMMMTDMLMMMMMMMMMTDMLMMMIGNTHTFVYIWISRRPL